MGSVKFFKAIIVGFIIMLIIIPCIFAGWFAMRYYKQVKINEEISMVNKRLVEEYVDLAYEKSKAKADEKANEGQSIEEIDEPRPQLPSIQASLPYQKQYPHLYVENPPSQWQNKSDVCYLTFDDGPSQITTKILQTLEKNNVKATFFITGASAANYEETLRKAAVEGHTIGVHTWSHEYSEIYSSVEAYLEDFNKVFLQILEVTGTAPTIFRFPGGSINAYNQTVYKDIIAEMTRRGFVFYDWNAAANDAVAGGISKAQVYKNVISASADKERLIVLMHDRSDTQTTADALQEIIDTLGEQGFSFEALNNKVRPISYFTDESSE